MYPERRAAQALGGVRIRDAVEPQEDLLFVESRFEDAMRCPLLSHIDRRSALEALREIGERDDFELAMNAKRPRNPPNCDPL
jgi:hypothetical protein